MNYALLRKLFFLFPPEQAHHLVLDALKLPLVPQLSAAKVPEKPKTVAGLRFRNPVGLAAGLDKDAKYFRQLWRLGFGFIEVGTVTPRPQPGNPQPRLFRLPKDQAIINRMGFNNEGVEAMAKRLQQRTAEMVIGGNIGKNKDTSNEEAWRDYVACLERLQDVVDYFVVNVSSPNTPGLRELQGKEALKRILSSVLERNEHGRPVFLKIAPDLNQPQLEEVVELCLELALSGIIGTNTTVARPETLHASKGEVEAIGNGGLSGQPLTQASTDILWQVKQLSGGQLALIGSGGVMSGADAKAKFEAGADLVQLYTGFIYRGPDLIREAVEAV